MLAFASQPHPYYYGAGVRSPIPAVRVLRAAFITTVFVNGQPANFSVPLTPSSSLACASPAPLPFDRFAR
jgi:hypothetical protein